MLSIDMQPPVVALVINAPHEVIVDPTIADAVLDRLVHTAYRFALDGETLRKPTEKPGKPSKLDTDNAE
jgi:IstB-like ATP binding protein